MSKLLLFLATSIALASCSATKPNAHPEKPNRHFEMVSNSASNQIFIVEQSSGCVWLVIEDWSSVKPANGEKRGAIQADKNFAKGLDQYALISVRTANQKFCETEFNLGIDPLKEIRAEATQ